MNYRFPLYKYVMTVLACSLFACNSNVEFVQLLIIDLQIIIIMAIFVYNLSEMKV